MGTISKTQKMAFYYVDYAKCANHVIGDIANTNLGGKFIIYPFGERGKLVKSILNVYYGIKEYMIVDNGLSGKYESIKSLNDLSKVDLSDVVVLVSSDREDIYDSLREALYAVVPKEQCFDLFPRLPEIYFGELPDYDISNEVTKHLWNLTARQSAEYILSKMDRHTREFSNRYEMIEHLMCEEVDERLGMFLEFGVFQGRSINFISTFIPTKNIYGFDSFEGLPEDWRGDSPKGTFNLHGGMPDVRGNVKLVKGWFEDTLPKFLKEHTEKCAFIHIDSDIYSSARTVFNLLGERIVPGTVIEFDEYLNRPRWQENEFKAFQEFIHESGRKYRYIGYDKDCQVSVKIIS